MAFTPTTAQRELANRKILEELQLKKQLLLKQGAVTAPVIPLVPTPPGALPFSGAPATLLGENHTTSAQRAALNSAHSQSFGFFVSQDSSFEFIHELDVFTKPKVLYEQYPTPPHIASHMLHTMQACYGDITSKVVADLGCGSGVLALSSALMDANLAVGFEIDNDALDIFTKNVNEHEIENIEVIQCDVLNISNRWNKMFDTVVMNPPFGTKKNAGMDMKFLKKALELSNNVVYSLHKTSTRAHVLKVGKQCGAHGTVLANLIYDLPATYRFHKKSSIDINVDFIRFEVNTN